MEMPLERGVVEVFESERFYLLGWAGVMLPLEWSQWTALDGKLKITRPELDQRLPDTHEWACRWQVDRMGASRHGWNYSSVFHPISKLLPREVHSQSKWSPKREARHFVRTRRWVRIYQGPPGTHADVLARMYNLNVSEVRNMMENMNVALSELYIPAPPPPLHTTTTTSSLPLEPSVLLNRNLNLPANRSLSSSDSAPPPVSKSRSKSKNGSGSKLDKQQSLSKRHSSRNSIGGIKFEDDVQAWPDTE